MKPRLKEAAEWHSKGLNYDDPRSQYAAGLMFGRGDYTELNYDKCAQFLMMARDNPKSDERIRKLSEEKLSKLKYSGGKWRKRAFETI